MRIPCPVCGKRSVSEFTYGGDATSPRPAVDDERRMVWQAHIYERDNPRGRHQEYWHHSLGCRTWFILDRDTTTHRIYRSALCPPTRTPMARRRED